MNARPPRRLPAVRGLLALVVLAALCTGSGACSHFVILNDPLSPEEHNDLGVAYETAGKLDLARREYRRALSKKPDLVIARVNLGNLESAAGRWSAAERTYRRALRDAPDDPHALNNLAWALFKQEKKLDEAEALARRAVAAVAGDATFQSTLDAIVTARAKAP
jgi:Flp pilus assembly protein TadD